ncbi:hypothetical protein Btru_043041 [Bulinus truncatus]|nr:hypothetical protein Btru_043041 [Bulinus truncatus]
MLQLLCVLTAVVGVSTAATAEALTDEVINAFLEVHNVARGEVSVPPLIWNQTISDYASAYASNCVFKHSTGPYGENIYASSPVADNAIVARRAVKMWNDEKVNVDLPNWNCFARSDKTCGHYSQVVWKGTVSFGCAIIHCDPITRLLNLVICNYWPRGNYIGQTAY